MATVTNKRKGLSVEGKVKAIRQLENEKKKADVGRKVGLLDSTIEMICKNRTIIISALEQNGSRIKLFRKPEVTSLRRCLGGFSKRQVTMYSSQ
jgi:hypothetical protein